MSTRTTSAVRSRKARENLIRLLFQAQDDFAATGKQGPGASSSMLHSQRQRRQLPSTFGATATVVNTADCKRRHSYSQLRAAYLEKVHAMHPDKLTAVHHDGRPSKDMHLEFIELKNAWEEYHATVRITRRQCDNSNNQIKKNSQENEWEEEEHFTMFGVGCSFADSPEERDLRFEITEQACRGWFPSGSISYSYPECDSQKIKLSLSQNPAMQQLRVMLSDSDMFIIDEQPVTKKDNINVSDRKYLVQNIDKFKKKR